MYGYRGILLIRMHRILLKTARQGSSGNTAQRNNSDSQWTLPAEYGKNIANKRPRDCTIGNIIDYMTRQGNLRDAQIGAIKTYLFLKIGCENKPLATLSPAEGLTH